MRTYPPIQGGVNDLRLMSIARSAVRAVLPAPSTSNHTPELDEDDLLSDAMLGVARADLAWDPAKGPFSAYARLRAIGHVRDGIRDRGPLSRGEWTAGLREHDLPAARRSTMSADVLLDAGWEPHSPAGLGSTLESDDAISRVLAVLPPRERFIIRTTVLDGLYLREAGAALGVTEARACQLRTAGLARLRGITHPEQLTSAGPHASRG